MWSNILSHVDHEFGHLCFGIVETTFQQCDTDCFHSVTDIELKLWRNEKEHALRSMGGWRIDYILLRYLPLGNEDDVDIGSDICFAVPKASGKVRK